MFMGVWIIVNITCWSVCTLKRMWRYVCWYNSISGVQIEVLVDLPIPYSRLGLPLE